MSYLVLTDQLCLLLDGYHQKVKKVKSNGLALRDNIFITIIDIIVFYTLVGEMEKPYHSSVKTTTCIGINDIPRFHRDYGNEFNVT